LWRWGRRWFELDGGYGWNEHGDGYQWWHHDDWFNDLINYCIYDFFDDVVNHFDNGFAA